MERVAGRAQEKDPTGEGRSENVQDIVEFVRNQLPRNTTKAGGKSHAGKSERFADRSNSEIRPLLSGAGAVSFGAGAPRHWDEESTEESEVEVEQETFRERLTRVCPTRNRATCETIALMAVEPECCWISNGEQIPSTTGGRYPHRVLVGPHHEMGRCFIKPDDWFECQHETAEQAAEKGESLDRNCGKGPSTTPASGGAA